MVICCPSCSARYQLADSKIKDSGTKVRCPRCSHTFMVHPERDKNDESDRTELFMERPNFDLKREQIQGSETLLKKKPEAPVDQNAETPAPVQKTKQSPPSEKIEFDGYDSVFDQKTMVSRQDEEKAIDEETEDKGSQVEPRQSSIADLLSNEDSASEDHSVQPPSEKQEKQNAAFSSESSESEIKPFGDATLFEIKKWSKPKKNFSSILKKAVGLLFIGGLGYLIFENQDQIKQQFQKLAESAKTTPEKPTEVVNLTRPSGWYRDEPEIYQEALVQIAAMPAQDREQPQNRALLSEALILNGLSTGATEQVNRGLSFIPSLVINYPSSAFSLYGSAAFAIWNRDQETMNDLIQRWPEAQKTEPEFQILELAYLKETNAIDEAIQKAASLTDSRPGFQRANNLTYLLILQNKKKAENYFSSDQIKKIENLYERHRKSLEAQLQDLPPLQKEIDQLLGKKSESATKAPAEAKKVEPPAPAPKKAPPPTPKAKEAVVEKKSTTEKKAAPAKSPTRLPKPNPDLIAANQASENSKSKATEFLEKGNDLFDKGDSEGALQSYQEALKLDEGLAEVWKRKGMIHMSRKESQRALRSFKMYLLLKPQTGDKQLVEGWIKSLQ